MASLKVFQPFQLGPFRFSFPTILRLVPDIRSIWEDVTKFFYRSGTIKAIPIFISIFTEPREMVIESQSRGYTHSMRPYLCDSVIIIISRSARSSKDRGHPTHSLLLFHSLSYRLFDWGNSSSLKKSRLETCHMPDADSPWQWFGPGTFLFHYARPWSTRSVIPLDRKRSVHMVRILSLVTGEKIAKILAAQVTKVYLI